MSFSLQQPLYSWWETLTTVPWVRYVICIFFSHFCILWLLNNICGNWHYLHACLCKSGAGFQWCHQRWPSACSLRCASWATAWVFNPESARKEFCSYLLSVKKSVGMLNTFCHINVLGIWCFFRNTVSNTVQGMCWRLILASVATWCLASLGASSLAEALRGSECWFQMFYHKTLGSKLGLGSQKRLLLFCHITSATFKSI